MKNLSQDSRPPRRDSNLEPPKDEVKVSTTQQQQSAICYYFNYLQYLSPILSPSNSVHFLTACWPKFIIEIFLQSTSRFIKVSQQVRFIYLVPDSCYMPSHSLLLLS